MKTINLILFLMLSGIGLSYGQFTVTGRVSDSATRTGLGLVSITIRNENAGLRKSVSSDSSGNFRFTALPAGRYILDLSFITHNALSIPFYLHHDTALAITMAPAYRALQQAALTARKPIIERKLDRLIFNVGNNINTFGADALELLSKTPQVQADEKGISIIGKSDLTVLINEKPVLFSGAALAAYLKTIPAASVDRIEVMTNPNATYSANGSSGIINLVIKRSRQPGYSGSANLTGIKNTNQGISGGLDLNYNQDAVRYYASLNGSDGSHVPTGSQSIYYPDRLQLQDYRTKELSQYLGGQLGFDADLSKRSILGATINITNSFPYQTNTIVTSFVDRKIQRTDSVSRQDNESRIVYRNYAANIHFEQKFDTIGRRKLVVDGDWSSTTFNFPNTIDNTITDSTGAPIPDRRALTVSNNDESSRLYSLNSVVYLPGKIHSLSFGGKINFIHNQQDILFSIDKAGSTTDLYSTALFRFDENTQAFFLNYELDPGKKWSFQTGLRGEHTATRGHLLGHPDSINTNNYFNLFPTAYLMYKLNAKNTLSANYGRRINRPGFKSLNPYDRYLSQYQQQIGNPFLQPSIFNNFELSETYDNNLSISLQYSFSNDQAGALNLLSDTTNMAIFSYANFLSTRAFLSNISYTIPRIRWLQSVNELDVYYNKTFSTSQYTAPLTKGWGGQLRSNNTLFFNKTRTIQGGVYFTWQLPETDQLSRNGHYYFLDLAARYLLLKNRLQLALRISDLFRTKNVSGSYIINGILTRSVDNNDSRKLNLSIRYEFGNGSLKKGQAHSAETNGGRALN